jgi:hypothetical protein
MKREERKRTSKHQGGRSRTGGRVRRTISASCAAAGVALVLEAASGCGSSTPPKPDTPVYAIMPPRTDSRVDGTKRDAQVYAILPPRTDSRVDGTKRDAQVYAIMPPQTDSRVDGTKRDAQVYAIMPIPPKQG